MAQREFLPGDRVSLLLVQDESPTKATVISVDEKNHRAEVRLVNGEVLSVGLEEMRRLDR